MRLKSFTCILLTLLVVNCQHIGDSILNSGNGKPGTLKSIVITDTHPDSIQWDRFGLNSVAVSGDTLRLNISYSGGCKNHAFELFMSPAAFMESFPVQANIYLRHNANGDGCEALITEELFFNISPIAEAYRQSYHSRAGTVLLNIFEYSETLPGKKLQVNYSFL